MSDVCMFIHFNWKNNEEIQDFKTYEDSPLM